MKNVQQLPLCPWAKRVMEEGNEPIVVRPYYHSLILQIGPLVRHSRTQSHVLFLNFQMIALPPANDGLVQSYLTL